MLRFQCLQLLMMSILHFCDKPITKITQNKINGFASLNRELMKSLQNRTNFYEGNVLKFKPQWFDNIFWFLGVTFCNRIQHDNMFAAFLQNWFLFTSFCLSTNRLRDFWFVRGGTARLCCCESVCVGGVNTQVSASFLFSFSNLRSNSNMKMIL